MTGCEVAVIIFCIVITLVVNGLVIKVLSCPNKFTCNKESMQTSDRKAVKFKVLQKRKKARKMRKDKYQKQKLRKDKYQSRHTLTKQN